VEEQHIETERARAIEEAQIAGWDEDNIEPIQRLRQRRVN